MKRTLLNASLLFTATLALVYTQAFGQTTTHHAHATQTARRAATAKATTPSQGATTQPAVVRVSAEGRDAAEPSIAAAKYGSVFVVWVEHGADGAADVWLAHFAADGRRLGATPTRVNPKAGLATAWRGDAPSITIAPDGRTIYVGWMAVAKSAASSSSGDSAGLHLSASRDGGRTFAPPVKVRDDPKPAAHGMHSLTVAEDGRVHLAWLDERGLVAPHAHAGAKGKTTGHHMEANRQVYTAYSADGGRTFSPNHLVARDACPCCKTSLAAGAGGRIYVSWRQVLAGDFRHIAVAASEDSGQKFSAPVIVSDDRWMLKGCPVSGASLAVGGDGALNVAWYTAGEAGEPGIYWSESRDFGQTFTARRVVAQGKAQGTPTLLAGNDGIYVVWESREGGAAHPASARIERGGSESASSVHDLAQSGELPSATAVGDGRLFVAYVSKRGDRRMVSLVRAGVRDAPASQAGSKKPARDVN
jgi:hypothetical protein